MRSKRGKNKVEDCRYDRDLQAVVVDQLTELQLPISQVHGLIPVVDQIF